LFSFVHQGTKKRSMALHGMFTELHELSLWGQRHDSQCPGCFLLDCTFHPLNLLPESTQRFLWTCSQVQVLLRIWSAILIPGKVGSLKFTDHLVWEFIPCADPR
jgi:hypothetical protein